MLCKLRLRYCFCLAVVSGEKLFVLFSPWELERLYPTARAEGALNNTSAMGSVLTRRTAGRCC
jgi:hypothetical protein